MPITQERTRDTGKLLDDFQQTTSCPTRCRLPVLPGLHGLCAHTEQPGKDGLRGVDALAHESDSVRVVSRRLRDDGSSCGMERGAIGQ